MNEDRQPPATAAASQAPDALPAALEALQSRRSVPALCLREPGPSPQQLEAAIAAALRAPDHGQLRPWRFRLISGAARARLADLFERRMSERYPDPPVAKIAKARARLLAAPLVIAVGARILTPHKVPEVEQLLSTGAAVMNLLNAFHAEGYGAQWLTGENAYDRAVADALGFAADERCLGFLYVGSIAPYTAAARHAPDRGAIVREWTGQD